MTICQFPRHLFNLLHTLIARRPRRSARGALRPIGPPVVPTGGPATSSDAVFFSFPPSADSALPPSHDRFSFPKCFNLPARRIRRRMRETRTQPTLFLIYETVKYYGRRWQFFNFRNGRRVSRFSSCTSKRTQRTDGFANTSLKKRSSFVRLPETHHFITPAVNLCK